MHHLYSHVHTPYVCNTLPFLTLNYVIIYLCSAPTCPAPCQLHLATDCSTLVLIGGLPLVQGQLQEPANVNSFVFYPHRPQMT